MDPSKKEMKYSLWLQVRSILLMRLEHLNYNNNRRKHFLTGEVGYIISGIKDAREVKVGDTITRTEEPAKEAIQGFEDVKPMVFAGIYPVTLRIMKNT